MSINKLEQWRSIKTEDQILNNELDRKDKFLLNSFSNNLKFSSFGIQGVMGVGTNKINIHTISGIAQAYAQFLISNADGSKELEIVIGHDNRKNSILFSNTVSNVLLNNGIKVYLLPENKAQPSSLVSYLIRKMGFSGGAVITSSSPSKENNGFKIYNKVGGQLSSQSIKLIQQNMKELNILEINKKSSKNASFIQTKMIESYTKDLLKKVQLRDDKKNVKVAFSSLHGTMGELVPDILDKMGVKHSEVKKQSLMCEDFKFAKSFVPGNAKSYEKVLSLARKEKSDVAFVTNPNGGRVGAVVKYQRRYKYLNGNQMAALYLDYKLNQLNDLGKIPKDGYIIKSVVSGDLSTKIAKKFGIKIVETNVGFKNIAEAIENTPGTFIMAFEETYSFIFDESITRDKDSLQVIIGIVEMVNYYKSKNINTFEHLKDLWKEFGIHRTVKNSSNIDDAMLNRLIKNISKLEKINNHKIVSKIDYRKDNKSILEKTKMLKLILDNGSWIIIRPSEVDPKVKTYIQTIGSKNDEILDVVVFEKEIESIIEENSESYPEKNISKKSITKYILFLSIMIITLYLVFKLIYDGTTTKGATFEVAKNIFTSNCRWIFLIGFIAYFFPIFLHAFQKKRLIGALGQKVKWRYLAISAFMGTFISWITPFAIGGDAVGYWFLRRKGFKRGPLASSFLMGTIIYQFQIVLVSSILLPMGIIMFHDEIFNGSAEMKVIITLFIIGACWNLFATFMIYMLTFNKKFQEWIVRTTIKLLEWLPFVNLQDPGKLAATHQFTFFEIRLGMKSLWKRKMLLMECTFYEVVTSFINFYIFVPMLLGLIMPGLQYGSYFSPIVASDIIGTANSYSITPGGSGTGEYILMTVNSFIYKPVNGVGNSAATSTALDFLQKIIVQWPILIGSMISIILIILGEKRVRKYKRINNNNKLKSITTNHKTSFYKKASIPLLLLFTGYLLTFFLIL